MIRRQSKQSESETESLVGPMQADHAQTERSTQPFATKNLPDLYQNRPNSQFQRYLNLQKDFEPRTLVVSHVVGVLQIKYLLSCAGV